MSTSIAFSLLVALAYFIVCGAPYAYLIGAVTVLGLLLTGNAEFLAILPQRMFSQLDVFTLLALPLFLLAAEIMTRGGATRALIDASMAVLGRSPGALGNVNIITSFFFGGVSGSAIADAASLGKSLTPIMVERGYSREYAAAITAASAVIGPIIPPSIIMILYAAITQTDIAALFAAGVLPGIALAVVLVATNIVMALRQSHPRGESFSLSVLVRTTIIALPALCMPILILGGIVFGVATPSEAGAVAFVAATGAGWLYTRITVAEVWSCVRSTAMLTGAMFMLLAAASLVSYLAALGGIPDWVSSWVLDANVDGYTFLYLMTAVLLIFGMFTGVRVALFLIVPLLAPAALTQGVDAVHLGIVTCLALTLGLLTPPFGPVVLVTSTVTGVPYADIVRWTMPFLVVEIALLMILVMFPGMSIWLPQALGLMR